MDQKQAFHWKRKQIRATGGSAYRKRSGRVARRRKWKSARRIVCAANERDISRANPTGYTLCPVHTV